MPLADRLYLTSFLFDPPAADWMSFWEENNVGRPWDDFLLAVKQRFEPDLYEDHVGRLATLTQTTSVEAYQTAFESSLLKVSSVEDSTLTSLFIAGLKPAIKHELLTKRPSSLQDACALAQQVEACHLALTDQVRPPTQNWSNRGTRHTAGSLDSTRVSIPHPKPPRSTQPTGGLPIVRISSAERAEKRRKGECDYCPEKWSRDHVCSKRFLAMMGPDDEEELLEDGPGSNIPTEVAECEDDGETLVITGDVSSINVIGPALRPRSIRIAGSIKNSKVTVLIDGGSTHNFIKPVVAEQLSLTVHPVTPFRVFVGNGASLKCSYACLQTPIILQGHNFDIDLFILRVEGPDVILGVQWLQDLGDVTNNFRDLTMRFTKGDQNILLQGEGGQPRRISYNNLFSLFVTEPEAEIFEIVAVPTTPDSPTAEAAVSASG